MGTEINNKFKINDRVRLKTPIGNNKYGTVKEIVDNNTVEIQYDNDDDDTGYHRKTNDEIKHNTWASSIFRGGKRTKRGGKKSRRKTNRKKRKTNRRRTSKK